MTPASPADGRHPWTRRAWQWVDRRFGRGSYEALRVRLDPSREYSQRTYSKILSQLVPGSRWLDAGCGHRVSDCLSPDDERALVKRAGLAVGCDRILPALLHHRTVARRACGMLGQLPFAQASFTLVTLNMVVEHLEDPRAVFTDLARILAPGGYLVVHTPNASSYFIHLLRLGHWLLPTALVGYLVRHLEGREPGDDLFRTHYRANNRKTLESMLAEAGFHEDSVRLLADRPLLYFAAPLSAVELLLTRALMHVGLETVAANTLLGIYRRTDNRRLGCGRDGVGSSDDHVPATVRQ